MIEVLFKKKCVNISIQHSGDDKITLEIYFYFKPSVIFRLKMHICFFLDDFFFQNRMFSIGKRRIQTTTKNELNIPSTFPSASTHIVCIAGMAQAIKWNRCDLFSMASCPHFNPAAKNHANVKHAHQANAAIQQKYNAMNKMVHNVDCRCPCFGLFKESKNMT